MKKILLLFLFCTSFTFAQNHKGGVFDKNSNSPLQGVHVSSTAILSNTFTATDGTYFITLKKGATPADSISFTSVGYDQSRISIQDLKATDFNVLLSPATGQLREVNIRTSRPLKTALKYRELAEMGTAVYDFASVIADGKIYVLAGDASFLEDPIQDEVNRRMGMVTLEDIVRASGRDFTLDGYSGKVQVYDIKEDKWQDAPFKIRKRAGHTAVLHENKIYILGGKNLQMAGRKEFLDDKIEILDLEKDTLIIDHVNPHQAIDAAAFSYNGNLMVLGGSLKVNKIGNKIFSNEVHMLNLQSGLWFKAGKMKSGKETLGIRVEDELFLIGGNDGRFLSKTEVLNLRTGLWEQRADLPVAVKDPAVAAHNGIIYIYERSNFFTYNTKTGELQNFRIDLDIEGPGMQFSNGKIYLFGGHTGNDYTRSPVNKCYSIDLKEFETTAIISYSRN